MAGEVVIKLDGDVWAISDGGDNVRLTKNALIIVHARKDQGDEVRVLKAAVDMVLDMVRAAVDDMLARKEGEV